MERFEGNTYGKYEVVVKVVVISHDHEEAVDDVVTALSLDCEPLGAILLEPMIDDNADTPVRPSDEMRGL